MPCMRPALTHEEKIMDEFASLTKGLTSPGTKHFAIIPDDTAL